MNTGKIVKSKTTERYVTLENSLIQATHLTLEEKGLLAFLLSLPADWVLYKKSLPQKVNESKGKVDRVFKGLQEKGYIVSMRVHNKAGQFIGWEHVVYDYQVLESPRSEKAEVGESQPIQKTYSITNKHLIQKHPDVLYFNDDESNEAWKNWTQYRRELKRSLTNSSIKRQVEFLNGFAPHTRAEIINQSIQNGWQGLFELKTKQKKNDVASEIRSIYSGLE